MRRRAATTVPILALTAALVAVLALGGAALAAGHPSCASFLSKKTIMEVNGQRPVELTRPDAHSAVGDWVEGPRSACFASYEVPGAQPGDLLETSAVWGVGYGLTAKQWNRIKNDEGGVNSVEGSGPWSRQAAGVGRGSHAFIATTTALAQPGEEPTHYLYVLTAKGDLLYLEIDGATPTRLASIARQALVDHPEF
jgi:hypothetical protein